MDEKDLKKATEVFNTICKALDSIDWHYKTDLSDFLITYNVSGDDLPMSFRLKVDAERKLVTMHSVLPFRFDEKHRVTGALATSYINYILADGSFDYDIRDGEVLFRLTTSYRESLISEDVVLYMVRVSNGTVDDYNDKLFMLSKDYLSLDDFVKELND